MSSENCSTCGHEKDQHFFMIWLKHSMKVQQKLTAKKKLKDNYPISYEK